MGIPGSLFHHEMDSEDKSYWQTKAFEWLRNHSYNNFDLDSCLKNLEEKRFIREAALAAFWNVYLGNESALDIPNNSVIRLKELIHNLSDANPKGESKEQASTILLLVGTVLASVPPSYPLALFNSSELLDKGLKAYAYSDSFRNEDSLSNVKKDSWKKLFDDDLFSFSEICKRINHA